MDQIPNLFRSRLLKFMVGTGLTVFLVSLGFAQALRWAKPTEVHFPSWITELRFQPKKILWKKPQIYAQNFQFEIRDKISFSQAQSQTYSTVHPVRSPIEKLEPIPEAERMKMIYLTLRRGFLIAAARPLSGDEIRAKNLATRQEPLPVETKRKKTLPRPRLLVIPEAPVEIKRPQKLARSAHTQKKKQVVSHKEKRSQIATPHIKGVDSPTLASTKQPQVNTQKREVFESKRKKKPAPKMSTQVAKHSASILKGKRNHLNTHAQSSNKKRSSNAPIVPNVDYSKEFPLDTPGVEDLITHDLNIQMDTQIPRKNEYSSDFGVELAQNSVSGVVSEDRKMMGPPVVVSQTTSLPNGGKKKQRKVNKKEDSRVASTPTLPAPSNPPVSPAPPNPPPSSGSKLAASAFDKDSKKKEESKPVEVSSGELLMRLAQFLKKNPGASLSKAPTLGPTLKENADFQFVESLQFEEGRPLEVEETVLTHVVSHEGFSKRMTGTWISAEAEQHWPTLFWVPQKKFQEPMQVPLYSFNTTLSNAPKKTGLVVVRVRPGWRVSLNRSADSPLIRNSEGKEVKGDEEHSETKDHYFHFQNVFPGPNVIRLEYSDHQISGSVVVPVVSGVATYLDLTNPQYIDLKGRVLDASAQKPTGYAHTLVYVVGQENRQVKTNRKGEFHLKDVLTFSGLPLYVETAVGNGFRHRYRTEPKANENLTLFRFKNNQLDRWIRATEESGYLVAAFPHLYRSYSGCHPDPFTVPKGDPGCDRHVYARLTPVNLEDNQPEELEVHLLNRYGRLENSGQPLDRKNPRFLAVELPDGFLRVDLENSEKAVIWSQLIYTSPGVVSIL